MTEDELLDAILPPLRAWCDSQTMTNANTLYQAASRFFAHRDEMLAELSTPRRTDESLIR